MLADYGLAVARVLGNEQYSKQDPDTVEAEQKSRQTLISPVLRLSKAVVYWANFRVPPSTGCRVRLGVEPITELTDISLVI